MASRRALLSAVGTATAVGTAGCVGRLRRGLSETSSIQESCRAATGVWPTAGGDARRSGCTDTVVPRTDAAATQLVSGTRGDASERKALSPPVVTDTVAYVPVSDGIVAVNLPSPEDGAVWEYELGIDGSASVPVLACGAVFLPGRNELAALNQSTGGRYWRAGVGSHHRSDAVAGVRDDKLYVAGGDVAAVDSSDGSVQSLEAAGETLAIGEELLFTTVSDSKRRGLFAYDVHGNEQWRVSGEFAAFPTVVDGTVWSVAYDGTVYSIEIESGEIKFAKPLPGVTGVESGLAADGGEVFVPAGTGTTSWALDAKTGNARWTVESGPVTGRPVVGSEWVAFGRTNHGISTYERSTGAERQFWPRSEYQLGTVDGLVPVQDGFVVWEGSSLGATLLR